MMQKRLLALSISTLLLTACGGDDDNAAPKTPLQSLGIQCASVETASGNQSGLLTPQLVDTYQSGAEFASAAAEIVSYDRCSDKLYVVNAQAATVDVLSLSATDSTPTKQGSIDLSAAAAAAQVEIGRSCSILCAGVQLLRILPASVLLSAEMSSSSTFMELIQL